MPIHAILPLTIASPRQDQDARLVEHNERYFDAGAKTRQLESADSHLTLMMARSERSPRDNRTSKPVWPFLSCAPGWLRLKNCLTDVWNANDVTSQKERRKRAATVEERLVWASSNARE